jgi:hypothetical protein
VAKQIQTNHSHHHTPSTRNIGNPEAFSQKIDFKEELKKLRKINSTVKKEFSEWLLAQPDSPPPNVGTVPSPSLCPSPSTPNMLGTPSTPTLLMSALTVRGTPLGTPNIVHTPSAPTTLNLTKRPQTNNSNNCNMNTNNNSDMNMKNMNTNNNSDESAILIKIDDDIETSQHINNHTHNIINNSINTDNCNSERIHEFKKDDNLNFDEADDNNENIKDSLFGSSENSDPFNSGHGGLFSSSSSLFHNNDSNSPPAYMEVMMHEDSYGNGLFIDDADRDLNQFDSSFILGRSLSPDDKW